MGRRFSLMKIRLLFGGNVQSVPITLTNELGQLAAVIRCCTETVAHAALGIECDLADILLVDHDFLFQFEIVKFDSHSALT